MVTSQIRPGLGWAVCLHGYNLPNFSIFQSIRKDSVSSPSISVFSSQPSDHCSTPAPLLKITAPPCTPQLLPTPY